MQDLIKIAHQDRRHCIITKEQAAKRAADAEIDAKAILERVIKMINVLKLSSEAEKANQYLEEVDAAVKTVTTKSQLAQGERTSLIVSVDNPACICEIFVTAKPGLVVKVVTVSAIPPVIVLFANCHTEVAIPT